MAGLKSSNDSEGTGQSHTVMNGWGDSCFHPKAFPFCLSASATIKLGISEFLTWLSRGCKRAFPVCIEFLDVAHFTNEMSGQNPSYIVYSMKNI